MLNCNSHMLVTDNFHKDKIMTKHIEGWEPASENVTRADDTTNVQYDLFDDAIYGVHEGTYFGHTYTTSGPTTYNIGSPSTTTVTLDPTPRDLDIDGDIKIGGQSLKDFMEVVSERLSILTPNPELLEKYDALKEAYEHYKILEKLCTDDGTVHKKT